MIFKAGDSVYLKFSTFSALNILGSLAGGPAAIVYKDNSTVESSSGIILTADFDSRTGLNHIAIDTSSDTNFYQNGHSYQVVLSAGTVGLNSLIGSVIGEFQLKAPLLTIR